jgi:hypothetical protein
MGLKLSNVLGIGASAVKLVNSVRDYRRKQVFLQDYLVHAQVMRTQGTDVNPEELKSVFNTLGPVEMNIYVFSGKDLMFPVQDDFKHRVGFCAPDGFHAIDDLARIAIDDAALRLSFTIRDQARFDVGYFSKHITKYRHAEKILMTQITAVFAQDRHQARYDAFILPHP